MVPYHTYDASASCEGAPASAEGALPLSGRDELTRPGPYGADGLYVHGPRRARPTTTTLDKLTRARSPEPAPPPNVARAQQRIRQRERRRVLERHARFAAAASRGWEAGSRNRPRRSA